MNDIEAVKELIAEFNSVNGNPTLPHAEEILSRLDAVIPTLERLIDPWIPITKDIKDSPRCLVFTPDREEKNSIQICPEGLLNTKSEATHYMSMPLAPTKVLKAV